MLPTRAVPENIWTGFSLPSWFTMVAKISTEAGNKNASPSLGEVKETLGGKGSWAIRIFTGGDVEVKPRSSVAVVVKK